MIQNVDQKNMRRFLVSMAKDVRVIIIKLADRLHNVETLEYLDLDKRKKIAKETLSIHAPLAQKIGMNDLKWRLEDESFKHLMPAHRLRREIIAPHVTNSIINRVGPGFTLRMNELTGARPTDTALA